MKIKVAALTTLFGHRALYIGYVGEEGCMKQEIIEYWLDKIRVELNDASRKFTPFNSSHEGYAVILEELDELWDCIKLNDNGESMQKEAVQVGAMALRFLIDCIK